MLLPATQVYLSSSIECGNPYIGISQLYNGGLYVRIITERLLIRSIENSEKEFDRYFKLYGDQDVMREKVKTQNETQQCVNEWVQRWMKGNPFAGLSVLRRTNLEFIGNVVLEEDGDIGEFKLAYHVRKKHRGQGYESEIVSSIVNGYAPFLILNEYVRDLSFRTIVATASSLDQDACQILENVGMIREKKKNSSYNVYVFDLKRFYETADKRKICKEICNIACVLL